MIRLDVQVSDHWSNTGNENSAMSHFETMTTKNHGDLRSRNGYVPVILLNAVVPGLPADPWPVYNFKSIGAVE
jgi:hypothetical protein